MGISVRRRTSSTVKSDPTRVMLPLWVGTQGYNVRYTLHPAILDAHLLECRTNSLALRQSFAVSTTATHRADVDL